MHKTTKIRIWLFSFILGAFSLITGSLLISNHSPSTQSTVATATAPSSATPTQTTQTKTYPALKASASTRTS